MPTSTRVNNISESKTIQLSQIIAEMRAQGESVIGLNVGEPDFSSPEFVKSALTSSVEKDETRYSFVSGIPEFRDILAMDFNKQNKTDFSAKNILISNGSKQILYTLFQTLLDHEDEVIVLIPYWVTIPESIALAGGRPVLVPSQDDLNLDINAIEKAITKKTKMIVINSPNNPSGLIYPENDLRQLASLAIKHNILIVADEAYEALTYERPHFGMAMISEEAANLTLTVRSFSKTHAMTGYRLGYVVANEKLIQGMNKLQSHLCGSLPVFIQRAGIEAIKNGQQSIDKMRAIFKLRRDLALKSFDFLDQQSPGGAFYLFPKIDRFYKGEIQNSDELTKFILKNAGVALVPGSAFGLENYLRISFAASNEDIVEAGKRVKDLLCTSGLLDLGD